MTIKIVAGEETYNLLQTLKQNAIPKIDGLYNSEQLCKFQEKIARHGFIGAQIVKSIYGYSVRYDSGLQNWGIIAAAKHGQLDGSFEDAAKYAEYWVSLDPTRRYAWVMESETQGV